jgi:glycosyltransferase involved in cell wall biosynthesis
MKILFVSNDPSIFDDTSPTYARMKEYANAIGTLHILTRVAPTYLGPSEKSDGNLFLHAVRGPRLFALWSLPARAHALILKEGIEVVSAQDPFEYGRAAAKAVKGTNAKLHIQIHTDFLSPWFTRSHISRSPQTRMPSINTMRQNIANSVLPQADGIRVVSKRIQDSLVATYGTRIVESSIIPIAVPDTLPPAVELPGHGFNFVLMAIGRLEPEKRIEDILVALARIKDTYPRVGLMIVGEGREHARLQHWVDVLGIGAHVLFLGNRPDAIGLLQNAHIFIQASGYEGYGRTFVEAALAKVPIITTDVGIIGEVLKGYDDVLATPPGDPTNLSVHMRNLIEDTSLRNALALHAEQTIRAYLASVHTTPADIAADLAKTLLSSHSSAQSV